MDPEQFFPASGVIIVAGKGGVGKTAVTAAMAVAASSVGLRTLVVEVEGKSGLPSMFGSDDFTYEQIELLPPEHGGGVVARTVTPDDALLDYLREHGMQRISNRLVASGALDLVATAVPGIRDILVLGKVKQLERSGEYDLILLDAHAAGHAITFLRSATGLATSLRPRPAGASGRVTTPTSSCRESAIASSAGRATSGVPANTTRIRCRVPSSSGAGRA